MRNLSSNAHTQRGSMLLEALISILIFSIGILAIIGLQAASIKMSSDAKYRSDASLLASQYISSMWSDAGSATVAAGTFSATEFDPYKTNGALFTAWYNNFVTGALPNAQATVNIQTTLTCNNTPCPMIIAAGIQQETVTLANITITWQLPGASSPVHTYATSAQITAQKIL